MTVARSQLVDLEVTPYYHCISRCVRRAYLCGEGYEHRKTWIENRLEELINIFAVSVSGFSVLDSHFHILVRLEGEKLVEKWTDREVARRWGRLYRSRPFCDETGRNQRNQHQFIQRTLPRIPRNWP